MSCNPLSYYPNKIDEMIFFQDNNLENIEIINHYNHLIAHGKYSEASDYIRRQENIYGFFADFFNLIDIRLFYSDNETDSKNLDLFHIFINDEELEKEEVEPPDINENTIWI